MGDKKTLIVVGANSAIAKGCISERAPNLSRLALCARDAGALAALADDIRVRHPDLMVKTWVCDLANTSRVPVVWLEMEMFCGALDEVVVAPGLLGRQAAMEADPTLAHELISINCAGVSLWVLLAARSLEKGGRGVLAVVTSVAGVRGRRSNYIYGSSKAQMIALLEGLRCRLWTSGVRVVDFRPGVVDSPMTAHLKKGILAADARQVGARLAMALVDGQGVVYSPSYWRAIMLVIAKLPFFVFKRLKF